MKYLTASFILLFFFLSSSAAELPEYLQELAEDYGSELSISQISDDDYEDDDDNEFLLLKFESFMEPTAEKREYLMRVTIQAFDKKTKSTVFAQTITKLHQPTNFDGHTDWRFHLPFAQMKNPKLTAYAIEFGFKEDGYFVPVATDYDHVDSADEILQGEGIRVSTFECAGQTAWLLDREY